MKYLIIILLPSIFIGQHIQYQDLLKRASVNNKACDSLINQFNNQNTNIEKGYLGAGLMIKAKHEKRVHHKWKYFQKGKKKLEDAINTEPNSIELRKIRNYIQNNTPHFLNYKNNRTEDEFFIKKMSIEQKKR